jgi:uncharacterized protein
MFGIEKPLPMPNEETEGYWELCRKGQLPVSACRGCGHRFLPPSRLCPACWSEEVAFEPTAGRGRVYSFVIVHRPQHPAFFADAPYNVAIVELDEGPRLHTRLVDVAPDAIRVGMEVAVRFQKIDDEISLPVFAPVR